MMKDILITGGAGFIGSNTVRYALNKGLTVSVLDSFENAIISKSELLELGVHVHELDIQDHRALETMREPFDAIVHLAAQVSVPKSIQDPEKNHSVNVDGAEHVLQFAKRNNVKRFIFASSSSVYGDCRTMPLREDSKGELQSPYAQSKSEVEDMIDECFQQGEEFLSLRFFNVYGPNQRFDSNYGAVIPIFIDRFSRGIQPPIYGSGAQSRDFVHVHDVARLLVDLATSEWPQPKQSVYNVGTGKAVTIIQLASLIHELTQPDVAFEPSFQPVRLGDIEHSVASIEAIRRGLRWEPKISLEDGLRELIEVNRS
ncbi:MAG: NAD-dependent epimerase/dehydratase family protein [Candidatus Poseidoniaceae archaeon]